MIGTPHYMAPEQLFGMNLDTRADLYALGAILYEMIAGCKPYDCDNTLDYVHKVVEGKLPRFSERVPGIEIPADIEELCLALMAKKPDDRPASAQIVLQVLELVERELPIDDTKPYKPIAVGSSLPHQRLVASDDVATQNTEIAPARDSLQLHGTTDQLRVRWWNPLTWWRRGGSPSR